MLEAVTTAVPHIVHLRCGGHITLDDLNRGIEAIEEALARTPRLHCLVEVEPLEQIDPAALWRDVLYGVSKLGSLHRFPRVAVVTDLSWIRTAAQIEHHLFPFITIRTFEAREMEAAQAWVAAEPSKPETAPPAEAGQGFVEVPTDDANVLAFEVDGRPTDAQIEAIVERLNAAYDAAGDGKVNLLVRIKRMDGLYLEGLGQRAVWAMKWRSLQRLDRYAIVGGPAWLLDMVRLMDPLLTPEMRAFAADDEAAAWAWVRETAAA